MFGVLGYAKVMDNEQDAKLKKMSPRNKANLASNCSAMSSPLHVLKD